jgi:hypothetical protein
VEWLYYCIYLWNFFLSRLTPYVVDKITGECQCEFECNASTKKLKQSHYTPQGCLGREKVQLLLIHDLGTRRVWVVGVMLWLCFSPRERTPSTHCTGGWVGPRASLDSEATGKIHSPLLGIVPRLPSHPARSETLYWLSYPARNKSTTDQIFPMLQVLENMNTMGQCVSYIHASRKHFIQ